MQWKSSQTKGHRLGLSAPHVQASQPYTLKLSQMSRDSFWGFPLHYSISSILAKGQLPDAEASWLRATGQLKKSSRVDHGRHNQTRLTSKQADSFTDRGLLPSLQAALECYKKSGTGRITRYLVVIENVAAQERRLQKKKIHQFLG